jgi:hypothetical protein
MNVNYQNYFNNLYDGKMLHQTEGLKSYKTQENKEINVAKNVEKYRQYIEQFGDSAQKYVLKSHTKNKQTSSCPAGKDIQDIMECVNAAKSLGLDPACTSLDSCRGGWNGRIGCIQSGGRVYPKYRSRSDNEQELCKNENFTGSNKKVELNKEKCPTNLPYRTRQNAHKGANYKYCYKTKGCAEGTASCSRSEWTDSYTDIPTEWPPVDTNLNEEKCPTNLPYRTKQSAHAGANYKYCYKTKGCAEGTASCSRSEWTDAYTDIPKNWPSGKEPKYILQDHEKNKQTSSCPSGQAITDIVECVTAAQELGLDPACTSEKTCRGGWNGNIPCIQSGGWVYPKYRSRSNNEKELCKNENFKVECKAPENATLTEGCNWVCNENYYKDGDVCKPHTVCTDTQIITTQGTSSSDRVCGTCDSGTFIKNKKCIPYTICENNQIVEKEGTATSNRICHTCRGGSYKNGNECLPFKTCAENEVIETPGTSTSDRVCNTCGEGSFKNGDECKPHTICSDTKIVDKEPTNVSDRTCKRCSNNTYKNGNKCDACTICDDLDGNKQTDVECTATSDTVCKKCEKPESSEFDSSESCAWTCNAGYRKTGGNTPSASPQMERFSNTNMSLCQPIPKTCANGTLTPIKDRTEDGPNCTQTGCNDGYYYLNGDCVQCSECNGPTEEDKRCTTSQNRTCKPCQKPNNSHFTSGCEWSCNDNFIELDGKCVDNHGYECQDNTHCSSGVCKGGHCCVEGGNGDDALCGKCNNKDSAYPGHCNTCVNHGTDNIWNKDRQPDPLERKGNWDCVPKPPKTTSSSGTKCLPWKTAQGGRQKWFAKNDSDNRCGDPDGSGFDWCYTSNGSSNYWESCQGSSNK